MSEAVEIKNTRVVPNGSIVEKTKKWQAYAYNKPATTGGYTPANKTPSRINNGGYFRRGGTNFIDTPIMNLMINPNLEADVADLKKQINRWSHFGIPMNQQKKDAAIKFVDGAVEIVYRSFTAHGTVRNWPDVSKMHLEVRGSAEVFNSSRLPDKIWRALFVMRGTV